MIGVLALHLLGVCHPVVRCHVREENGHRNPANAWPTKGITVFRFARNLFGSSIMVKQSGSSFAVVTGASSGIGFHLARVFAENGFDVLITAEDARLADAEKQLSNTGVKIYSVPADLTKSEEVERLWNEIQARARITRNTVQNVSFLLDTFPGSPKYV